MLAVVEGIATLFYIRTAKQLFTVVFRLNTMCASSQTLPAVQTGALYYIQNLNQPTAKSGEMEGGVTGFRNTKSETRNPKHETRNQFHMA